MQGKVELEVKIVVVGDPKVGKSCLIQTFATGQFPDWDIDNVFESKTVYSRVGDHVIKLQVWDTSGSDQCEQLRPLSYMRADLFMICFSADNPQSFHRATTKWLYEINKFNSNALKMFVCTKMDRSCHHLGQINFRDRPALPYSIMHHKIEAMGYSLRSCSSACKEGVTDSFEHAIKLITIKIYGKELKDQKQELCSIM